MSTEAVFLEYSGRKLHQLAERICTCLDQLTDDQVWARGAESENAIGNLVLHLRGNVMQWIGSGVGRAEDHRDRDAEFAARDGASVGELKSGLRAAVAYALGVLKTTPDARLSDRVHVQGYDVSGLEAIYHVVEHFAGHTGQIVFATKLFTGKDLEFYRHLDGGGGHAPPAEATP